MQNRIVHLKLSLRIITRISYLSVMCFPSEHSRRGKLNGLRSTSYLNDYPQPLSLAPFCEHPPAVSPTAKPRLSCDEDSPVCESVTRDCYIIVSQMMDITKDDNLNCQFCDLRQSVVDTQMVPQYLAPEGSNVPYKAVDAAREEGQGSRGCTRRAGNYVSGRPFVRLQSTTAQVLRETGAFLQRARREEKGHQGKSERESCKERPRPCASMTRNEATKECRERRRADSAAVNIAGIRPVSKCTLGMRLA
ncbi:hypothetical protein EAG_11337 [Camponotus floridanus]|uniref:Uncharacterized protein n=1 Tax=Camponotus floridanus TaxID=104421 RepID=E2A0Z1_CAMFO|nr:hypothetical protein EAG_11337 [Camponotus floridanus]